MTDSLLSEFAWVAPWLLLVLGLAEVVFAVLVLVLTIFHDHLLDEVVHGRDNHGAPFAVPRSPRPMRRTTVDATSR